MTEILGTETYSYETGRALATYEAAAYSRCNAGYREAREAAANWRRALDDHAETSYWGVAHIRSMRGFWLGVARAIRAGDVADFNREGGN